MGLFCVCNALIPIYSSYLRAFGHTTPTLSATILSNVANAVLNVLFLLVFHWGVFGVALATGFSRVIHLIWLWLVSRRRIEPVSDTAAPANRELLRKIIQVGLPAAMETSLYNLAITIVISLLNSMDSTGMQATAVLMPFRFPTYLSAPVPRFLRQMPFWQAGTSVPGR